MQFPLASCNTTGRHTGNKKQIGKANILFHYKLVHANTVCKKIQKEKRSSRVTKLLIL